jgi:hypothetical protein
MKLRALGVPEKTVTQNSSVGSFAMSDAHVDMFLSALEVIKDCTVVEAMNDLAARIIRYNFGDEEPLPRVEATELSRVKYEVLVELLKSTLNVPHTTADGKTYTAASLLDVPKILRAVNAPQHAVEEVAQTPAPEAPPASPAPVAPSPAPPAAPPESPALAARLDRLETAALSGRPGLSGSTPPVNNFSFPLDAAKLEIPVPIVNVAASNFDPLVEALRNMGPVGTAVASVASGILGVERAITSGRDAIVSKLSAVMSLVSRQKAPTVNVTSPELNLDPIANAIREATASVMSTQSAAKAPADQKIDIERDRDGRITGARVKSEG